MKNGTVINFSTSPVPLYETDASSDYWVYTGTSAGSYLDIHNEDNMHPAIINSSSSVKVAWNAPAISSNELHLVSSSPLKIADIAFSVKPVYQQTFAVYSDDDKSLDFYKRVSTSLPAQGDTFNGKKATSVYTGFENGGYAYDQVSSTNTPWFEHHEDITKIGVIDSGIKIYNLRAFFSQLHKLTDGNDVVKFDTSECTDMHDLFYECTSLKQIDISKLDTSDCLYFSCVFHDCRSLKKINLSSIDLSKNQSLTLTFGGCNSLENIIGIESIDTSSCTEFNQSFRRTAITDWSFLLRWDVSNGANFNGLFIGCGGKSINVISKWNTSKAATFQGMFNESTFNNLDCISNWNISNVTTFNGMLAKMPNLQYFDISKWNIKTDADMNGFSNEDPLLRCVSLPASLSTSKRSGILPVPSAVSIDGADGYWYAKSDGSAYTVDDIPMKKADTYYAVPAFAVYSDTDKSLDFYNSHNVPKVGSTYKGKSVTNLYMGVEEMGDEKPAWRDIIKNVQTSTIVDTIIPNSIYQWFYGATSLTSLNIDKMDTRRVKRADGFLYYATIDSIDLSGRDFSSCLNFNGMLSNMPNLISVDVKNMNVSNGITFYDMFYRNGKLTTLDCTGWDTSKATDFWGFACANISLSTIDISSFTINKNARTDHMFGYDTEKALKELKIGSNCWLNAAHTNRKDDVCALPASKVSGSTGCWFSTTNGKAYEYVVDNCTYPYGITTTLKPQMKAETPDNLTISGKYITNQILTCNATAKYSIKYQWQYGRDNWWKDINGAVNSTLHLTGTYSLYKIRCVIKPVTEEYDGEFYSYSNEPKGENNTVANMNWYDTAIAVPSSAAVGDTIHIEQTGTLPNEQEYGTSTPNVTWMRDGGGIVVDYIGKTNTQTKSKDVAMSKWTGFIPHTYVYPGQKYTLEYGSLVENTGNDKCYIMLCDWTKNPGSGTVATLCDVPYSETGGKISFEIPDNLDKNWAYTILICAGKFGYNDDDFSATMTNYKITCDGNGFVPFKITHKTYDYMPATEDSGHKLIAIATWDNNYYKISKRMSDPIIIK